MAKQAIYMLTTGRPCGYETKKMNEEIKKNVSTTEVGVYEDPFDYFTDVIRGKITVPPFGLYSLENNMIVVKILELARQSAKTGKTINTGAVLNK